MNISEALEKCSFSSNKDRDDFDKVISLALASAHINGLRDAARAVCEFCNSPKENKCSVATLIQGNWYHIIDYEIKTHCRAAAIWEKIND